jgi:hypothetical protein
VSKKLLWIDCTAAALAGVAMLLLADWLSRLYAVPREVVVGNAAVNLLYGAYSFSLAVRRQRPRALILLLIGANAGWGVVCLTGAAVAAAAALASPFGVAHLIGEGLFVGGLAVQEWVNRDRLLTAD